MTDIINSEFLIPTLVFFSIIGIGVSILLLRSRKSKILKSKLEDNKLVTPGRAPTPRKSSFLQTLEKIGNFASHGQTSNTLWEQLVQAGYLNAKAPAIYTGIKMLLFACGVAVGVILIMPKDISLSTKLTLISMCGAVPFFIPNLVLLQQRKTRRDEICMYLPQAVDLLEICVSSGIGLNMAWNMVASEIQHVSTVLSNEMALTNFEIHLGANRAEAMRRMATRTGAEELASLAAILIQTDRFGTSMASALRQFARSMREERSFKAEENAEKMAVKLVIPMVLFIFPAVIVIITGPAIVKIFRDMILRT
ncbi:MAG: type II secretion system F family protein [Sedimentisphaerales bacterium]|nr:type II secretion system F family protein [Sedimentisphaerales bacterium]